MDHEPQRPRSTVQRIGGLKGLAIMALVLVALFYVVNSNDRWFGVRPASGTAQAMSAAGTAADAPETR